MREATFEGSEGGKLIQKSDCVMAGVKELAIRLKEPSTRACSLGQVSTYVNNVVGDHSESNPALDAFRFFVE